MWQVYEVKVITLTRGGLTSGLKPVVTTNGEKSAEAIVPRRPNEEKKTAREGLNFRRRQ
jgi:hypothetical protein